MAETAASKRLGVLGILGRVGVGMFGVVLIGATVLCGFFGWLLVADGEPTGFGLMGLMLLLGAIVARAAWALLTYAVTGREARPAVHPTVRLVVGGTMFVTVTAIAIVELAHGSMGSLFNVILGGLIVLREHRREAQESGAPTEPRP